MFLDKALDEIGRKNKIVIGLDLTNDYVQISYCRLDQSMPDTVSLVMGEEQYNIPAVLCRKHQQEGQEGHWQGCIADGKRWQRRFGRRPAFTDQE